MREEEAVLTIQQLCDEKGENQDSQPGQIISPGWVSHFPTRHSCIGQGLQQFFQLNIMTTTFFCDWGRRIKPRIDSW
jgi:hypothetical protein